MSNHELSSESALPRALNLSDVHLSTTVQRNFLKRAFDIAFSFTLLIFMTPLCLLIALAVKADSKGPAFYASKRVGRGKKGIKCWKFRTMYIDADERLQELLSSDPTLKQEWDNYRKLKNDPRITKVGRWLRKTSLDELPQFWNVLMGELSVVGPRPVTKEEIEKYFGDKAEKILSMRPGITGLWQTSGRSLLSFEERLILEESYIDQQSFLLDLWLICKTIPAVVFPKGAF